MDLVGLIKMNRVSKALHDMSLLVRQRKAVQHFHKYVVSEMLRVKKGRKKSKLNK